MLLVGDIGGTKTNLAVFASATTLSSPVAEMTFPSGHYESLEAIIQTFIERFHVQVDRACFGVAGPVVENQATITNLPWIISTTHLQETFHLKSVVLMNDLEAIAHAVPFLMPNDLYTLNAGQGSPGGAIAVIAPGTGLGEAFLTWDGQHYTSHTSEGGHADFAPLDELQIGMLRYLQPRIGHVSYEWVCSGIGLPHIYAYLKDSGYAEEPAWLAEQLEKAVDKTPVIVRAALDSIAPVPLCVATLDMFVSILGAEAGNLALKVLATGGVYIGGGIPPRILSFLKKELFMQNFLNKGRLGNVLTEVPIHVILHPHVGLLGAAYYGFELASKSK